MCLYKHMFLQRMWLTQVAIAGEPFMNSYLSSQVPLPSPLPAWLH